MDYVSETPGGMQVQCFMIGETGDKQGAIQRAKHLYLLTLSKKVLRVLMLLFVTYPRRKVIPQANTRINTHLKLKLLKKIAAKKMHA
jgi:hypothetical protein